MSNQYEVLGKAPGAEDLKNLSSKDFHLTIKNLNAGCLNTFPLNIGLV